MIPLVSLQEVSLYRGGKAILENIHLSIAPGDRILIEGENGAGKSSLILLLAGRLHPYNNNGRRTYAWDGSTGEAFREARKYVALVSRDEQNRLQSLHAQSSVEEFLTGHLDGQDFLYRERNPGDQGAVTAAIGRFSLGHLRSRLIKTLSLGEMRLALVARAALHPRKLYLLDEIFSGLSDGVAALVLQWIGGLPADAAVVVTSHDRVRLAQMVFSRHFLVKERRIHSVSEPDREGGEVAPPAESPRMGHSLIDCKSADFYHDFAPIFRSLTFSLRESDRILLTGPNGSGKTTLLRIMHGDFYPAWQSGVLKFENALAHEQKSTLWAKVQLIAAAHFSYYPAHMTVNDVLASRYSGSIYDYPEVLPAAAASVIEEFAIEEFLERRFAHLSEGEKTRVLLARAFLLAAPVYLIDEGFIALSSRFFAATVNYLNRLPDHAAIVIAANERIQEIQSRLKFRLTRWELDRGNLRLPGDLTAMRP